MGFKRNYKKIKKAWEKQFKNKLRLEEIKGSLMSGEAKRMSQIFDLNLDKIKANFDNENYYESYNQAYDFAESFKTEMDKYFDPLSMNKIERLLIDLKQDILDRKSQGPRQIKGFRGNYKAIMKYWNSEFGQYMSNGEKEGFLNDLNLVRKHFKRQEYATARNRLEEITSHYYGLENRDERFTKSQANKLSNLFIGLRLAIEDKIDKKFGYIYPGSPELANYQ